MSLTLFSIAAGISALTFGIHVLIGGRRVVRPLLASDLPQQLKGFLYLGWHSASVAIAAICAGFIAAAESPARKEYALLATIVAAGLVVAAIITSAKLKLPPARFPVIPLFVLVCATGVAGLVI